MVWLMLVLVAWVVCGFFSYALSKNLFRQLFDQYRSAAPKAGYCDQDEQFCRLMSLFGPFGLIVGVIVHFQEGCKLRLCCRMPKELCKQKSA